MNMTGNDQNMKPTALVISLNFNPGHVSHLVASYRQMEELGYQSICYVNPRFKDFLSDDINIVTSDNSLPEAVVAIITFPSLNNLKVIRKLRKRKSKVLYIFHEPLAPLSHYRKSGFSWKYLAKLWVIDHINALTVRWSSNILIPSKKAIEYYHNNPLYRNDNVTYLPLLYDDEAATVTAQRKYISYIGTVAADHSFSEFLQYVKAALQNGWHPDCKFLIATKSEFEVPESIKDSERVTIQKGCPLTNEEINHAYASSLLVWNAYIRTTQSGVLAKAYMFGTPALVMKHNLNEFMIEGQTVVSITDNRNTNQIHSAINHILAHTEAFSQNCRDLFMRQFYYKNHNETIKILLGGVS